jgi:phosphoglycerate dehydrogenase-like enzyme
MRIHIQNSSDDPDFSVTAERFEAASARAGEREAHALSFASDDAGFAEGIATAEVVIAAPGNLAGRFPCHAPSLRVIFCTAAGLDKLMPFDWLTGQMVLLNNRGVHGAKIGEYAAMALIALNMRLPAVIAAQHDGQWRPHFASTLRGRSVTVVGLGDLGGAAARKARHFGAEVTGVRSRAAPHPECHRVVGVEALDEVLPHSEFLILACPLTPATLNLLDRRRIGLLPAGAGVINVGRGGLLDQDALCDALDAGRLGGAMLDVFTPEPIPKHHRLWTTRNLIITPHVSADDPVHYVSDSLAIFFRNLDALRKGEPPPNLVDPARGY